MTEVSEKKIYLDARRMAWFAAISLLAVMVASIFELGVSSVPIVTAGLPTLGALVGAYVGIDKNWGRQKS